MASSEVDAPVRGGVAIDYSGGNQTLANTSRGIYISTAGNLVVTMRDGGNLTFTGLLAGVVYPIQCTVIVQSGSTAAGLALW